ncbi:MAG TPA: hypothetical protein PLU10_00390 [Chitinophagaceae bacterium]|nr:hypothetical protein [Chitinophagaceae bacterium]
MKQINLLLFFVVVSFLSVQGQLYVNPSTGLDTNPGTAVSPKQSLRGALRALTATNTTIYIQAGDYPYSVMTSNANRNLGFGPGQSVTSGINNAFLPGTVIEGQGCVYWHNSNDNGTGAQNSIMTVEAVNGFTIRNIHFLGWQGSNASLQFLNCTNVLIENCNFHQCALNSATALRFDGDATEDVISGQPNLTYTIKGCTFQNNGNPSGQGTGQALYVRNSGTSQLGVGGTFTVNIKDSRFLCNHAATGGAVYAWAVNSSDVHPTLNISSTSFSGNASSSQGGAMFAKYANLNINNSSFCNNNANSSLSNIDGGAVQVDQGATISVNECVFSSNVAGRYGSAIAVASNASSALIVNSVFHSNTAGNSTANVVRFGGAFGNLTNCLFKNNALTATGGPVVSGGTVAQSTFINNAGTTVSGTNVVDDHSLGANWIDPTGHAFTGNGTQTGYSGAYSTLLSCPACPTVPTAGACEATAGTTLSTYATCFYVCSDTSATTDISTSTIFTITSVAGWTPPCDISAAYHYYFLVVDALGNVVKVIDGDADSDGIPNFAETPAVNTDLNVGGITPPGVYTIRGFYTNGSAPIVPTTLTAINTGCSSLSAGGIDFTILNAVRVNLTTSCTHSVTGNTAPAGSFYVNIENVSGGFADLNASFFTPKTYNVATNFGTFNYNFTGTAIRDILVTYVGGNFVTAQVNGYTPQPSTCTNCVSQIFTKPHQSCTLMISGNVFNDANGLNDVGGGIVSGSGTNVGNSLYAYLVDAGNIIVDSVQVNAAGFYEFDNVTANTSYTVVLSTTMTAIGLTAPSPSLPLNWYNVGENIGLGIGNDGNVNGLSDGMITVNVGTGNMENINFGIEQAPNSTPYATTISTPVLGTSITFNAANPFPTVIPTAGNDPENGALGASNTIVFTTLPTNATLSYNGSNVVAGVPIYNFDPSLLTITLNTPGAISTTFYFSYVDAAGVADPSPASYVISWSIPLPVTLVSFTGKINNARSNTLVWKVSDEKQVERYMVERSIDGNSFDVIGNVLSSDEQQYAWTDNTVVKSTNYYRLKVIDLDHQFQYSEVIQLESKQQEETVVVYPSPAQDEIHIEFKGIKATTFDIIDLFGQKVSMSVRADGIYPIHQLPAGIYTIVVNGQHATKFIKK